MEDSATEILIPTDCGSHNPGTGTPGYWKNHPDAWPVDELEVGGVLLTKEEAITILQTAVKGDKSRAFASYERAYEGGYRFRSPVNEPLLLQWRDTEGFRQLQSRYDADIAREREFVLGQLAGSGFVVSVLPR